MKRQQSSSIVFLTELFLSLTIFALCSSVCAGLFSWSHRYSKESNALSHAVMAAQSGAEAFKRAAAAGDLADVLGGIAGPDSCLIYYNDDWAATRAEDASFTMLIRLEQGSGLRYAEIIVTDMKDAEIFKLKTSALVTEGKP